MHVDAIGGFRFTAGFGRTLSRSIRSGIGVHHGMLPRYRRLWSSFSSQTGLLKVICGTDTLGVGINVLIRTVVFTGLAGFDGSRQRILKAREFHQIAGRAGRAGFGTRSAMWWCRLRSTRSREPRAAAKAGDDPEEACKLGRSKPADGVVGWTGGRRSSACVQRDAETLVSRMRVNHANDSERHQPARGSAATLRALMEDVPRG